ncbi:retrovirus-related Pol polyprotein from transposon opus [Trichonephila clavipes]|nr:retrovirus-related Pol polyprotein from transposon opus [Trichonephila clavipes]
MPKNALADATLLRHPIPGAKLSLWTDASDKAVGGSLMQLCQNNWEPVAFFVSETLQKVSRNGPHMTENSWQYIFRFREALSKAQLEDNELQSFQNDEKSSLVFKRVPFQYQPLKLICDTSTGSPRPFVPHNFRRTIFEHFHNLAHPGVGHSILPTHRIQICLAKHAENSERLGPELYCLSTFKSAQTHEDTSGHFRLT